MENAASLGDYQGALTSAYPGKWDSLIDYHIDPRP